MLRCSDTRISANPRSCYLCRKGLRRGIQGQINNGGFDNRLMCFSSGSDGDGDSGGSSNDSNLATKEKEAPEREEGGRSSSEDKSTSFSSSGVIWLMRFQNPFCFSCFLLQFLLMEKLKGGLLIYLMLYVFYCNLLKLSEPTFWTHIYK